MNINPFLSTDGYKVCHHQMYPKNTTLVYSNFTPRSGKHSNIKGSTGVISFGQQMVMKQIQEMFDTHFFCKDTIESNYNFVATASSVPPDLVYIKEVQKKKVIEEIKKEYSMYLNTDYDVSHIEALWDLGYLPIEVKALPEGTFVPYGVPVLTIKNTLPEFYWLTNFLETLISNMLWQPMTSATTAFEYKKILTQAALKTDKEQIGFVEFQGHDFSMRGLSGLDATVSSGLGHATSFLGSDSLPVIHGARKYYGEKEFVVGSVNATEHSVMCAGTKDDEIGTFRELMKTFPTGILSIVSDTWDLWKVITVYLPQLKDEILARDGKIVIRPDSGDPVDIICGTHTLNTSPDFWNGKDEEYSVSEPEHLGVVQLLWNIFGGTVNEQGYKVLNPKIGAIYGDSITVDRAKQICERLEAKGFASTNVVLGVGSYTYQYVTRDTHGFAMKATYVEVLCNSCDGQGVTSDGNCFNCMGKTLEGREIFKNPITDDGTKKSAKGLLVVDAYMGELYELHDQQTWEQEKQGALETIFKDGKFTKEVTLTEIRSRINKLI